MALLNLEDFKNDTAREKFVRKRVAEVIKEALEKEFGNENVLYVPKAIFPNDGNSRKINCDSVVARVADIKDKDGYEVDLVVSISPEIKPYNTVVRKDGKTTYSINLDDIEYAIKVNDGALR